MNYKFKHPEDFQESYSFSRTKNLIHYKKRQKAITDSEHKKLIRKNLKSTSPEQREAIQKKVLSYQNGRIEQRNFKIIHEIFMQPRILSIALLLLQYQIFL